MSDDPWGTNDPADGVGGLTLGFKHPPSFQMVKAQKDDFVITEAVFDVKASKIPSTSGNLSHDQSSSQTAPGYPEEDYVGSHRWLEHWFPFNPELVTISVGDGKSSCEFSIARTILAENFGYFATAFNAGLKEAIERKFIIAPKEIGAFGLMMSFLMTGTFPQHPDELIHTTHAIIRDSIIAYRQSDYLKLKCMERFNRAVCLRLPQVLLANRGALRAAHVGQLYNSVRDAPSRDYYKDLVNVFAQAAVKPCLHGWMLGAQSSSVSCSVAFDEHCGKDPKEWVKVVEYYVFMVKNHNFFARDVQAQMMKTMATGRRLNRVIPAQEGVNKKIHNMPAGVDYVTYRDPLPEGKAQIFTI
ncbi:hypothetical protein COL922a_013362 [Colletotrichum nupharicola]|nr:hypothetical protein COL922a_013362 [Colletotrichum nupharicola]